MAVFSVNQNRHLFVATRSQNAGVAPTTAGDLSYKTFENSLYFTYMNGLNEVLRSDLIDKDKIVSMTLTSGQKLRKAKKSYKVALTANNGVPVSGQDYILRVSFRQFRGNSDTNIYLKYGAVHAVEGMTADMFYKTLALSLAKNFSRELTKVIKIEVHSKATVSKGGFDERGFKEVLPNAVISTAEADKTKNFFYESTGAKVIDDIDYLRIVEVEQPWHLGTMKQVPVYFDVIPTTITLNGDEVIWGTVTDTTDVTNDYITNSKNLADLEWFCMGERGDQYRGMNYPNNIHTQYMLDVSKEYDTLDIHYYFSDEGVGVQRSEKLLTIVFPHDAIATFKTWVTAISTAVGVTVKKVQVGTELN